MNSPSLPTEELILQAHQLYCQLTGQRLPMRFDRNRPALPSYRMEGDCGRLVG
jgi:hypothetical protein